MEEINVEKINMSKTKEKELNSKSFELELCPRHLVFPLVPIS